MTTSGRKPLSLKGGSGSGTVRQSLSHSRTKSVVVEKKRKRVVLPKDAEAAAARKAAGETVAKTVRKTTTKRAAPGAEARAPRSGADDGAARKPAKSGATLKTLTEEERENRAKALSHAKVRAVEDAKRAEEEAVLAKKREEEAKKRAEEEAKRQAEEEERRKVEEEARQQLEAEEETKRAAREKAKPKAAAPKPDADVPTGPPPDPDAPRKTSRKLVGDAELARAKRDKENLNKPTSPRKNEPARRRGKITLTQPFDDDDERTRSLASVRRAREREKRRAQANAGQKQPIFREVIIPEAITVQELASRMATRAVDVIKVLMKQGIMAKINDVIDADTAELIATDYGHTVKRVSESDVEEGLIGKDDRDEDKQARAPVVTIMGHVDHGKTSLLDSLRQTNVVSGEAGGITQHIGAYQVTTEGGDKISFLDTPGHAAFTQMRARGAKVTDIVILVVAADDSVMPQTAEAISHAKAAEVPIIVAINKIDKPDANPDKVRQDLLQHDLVVESLGGDIQDVEVSAIKKLNLDKLLESILLQSEILELKANPDRPAEGVSVEAKLDKGRGPVATVLIQRGTLNVGDVFVCGAEWGRVRALINDQGEQVDAAGPSVPVEVLGFQGTPDAGDVLAVVENEARAREISEYRQRKRRENRVTSGRGSLEQMLAQLKETDKKEFPVVIKGDVQGSVEAIVGALDQLGTDEVMCRPIHTAVGGITESDVILANASNCPIIAFNVRANQQARDMAQRDGIEIRYYSVIYDLVDDIKAAMSGLLDPTLREHFLGNAEILEVFNISKVGKVAGCRVTEGQVKRGAKVRLIRDNVVIHEGTLSTLKRFKDEVKEVHGGQECGMAFENYHDLQKGDVIECFEVEEIERTL